MFEKKKKNLSDFLDKDVYKSAIDNDQYNQIKKEKINYILINVKDNSINEIYDDVKSILDIIGIDKFLISNIICSFIIVLSDIHDIDSDSYLKSLDDILRMSDGKIRMLYGNSNGGNANLGNVDYQIYGPIIPGFNEKISKLLTLNFGEMQKYLDN